MLGGAGGVPLCAASPRGAPRQQALPFLAGGVLQDPSVPRRDPAVPVGVGCWCQAMGRVGSRLLEEGGEEGPVGPAQPACSEVPCMFWGPLHALGTPCVLLGPLCASGSPVWFGDPWYASGSPAGLGVSCSPWGPPSCSEVPCVLWGPRYVLSCPWHTLGSPAVLRGPLPGCELSFITQGPPVCFGIPMRALGSPCTPRDPCIP